MRRHHSLQVSSAIVVIAFLFALPAATRAQVIEDQSADPGGAYYAYIVGVTGSSIALDVAQTFTPAVTGTLSSIQVEIGEGGPPPQQSLVVDIRPAPGGTPQLANSPVLGSVTLTPSEVPAETTAFSNDPVWTSIDFSTDDIQVQAGVPLAIVMRSSQPFNPLSSEYDWFASNQGQNIYAGGSTWERTGGSANAWFADNGATYATDQGFREFVSVPEPASAGTLLASIALLVVRRRRRGIR